MIPCYPSSQHQHQQQLPMFAPSGNTNNPADQSLMLLQATEAFFGQHNNNNNNNNNNVEPTPINPSAPVQVGDVGPHNKELELSDMLDFSFTSMDDLNDDDDDLPSLFGNHYKNNSNNNNGMAPSVVSNSDLFKTGQQPQQQQQHDSSSLFSLLTTKQQDTMPTMMMMTNMPQASTTMTLSASAVVHTKKRSSAELISEDEESCQSSNKKTKTFLTTNDNNDDQPTVNISTRHIHALCSDKGPALCHDIIDCAEPADTSHMTEDEKALASKDRNRMHARNTRIRKKAYVDLLKTTLLQVCAQRDVVQSTQRQHEQSQLETRTVRFLHAQELLQCKARHEPNVQRWKVVADEAISVRVSGGGSNASAVGLPHVVLGHWMPHELLEGGAEESICCDRGSLLMDGDFGVLDWTCGMHVRGTIKCQFHPVTNKIVHAHLVVANTTAATASA